MIVLPGRYLDATGVERDCIVRCTSLEDVFVETDAGPAAGERIVCRIADLGLLAGTVSEPDVGGFRLIADAGAERRRRLASRIAWARGIAAGDGERREAARVIPLVRDVVVDWGAVRGAGRLRDLSATGAAVELLPRPPVGAPVTVGARRAVVARHTEHGFAVRFVLPLHPADVGEDAIL